MDIDFITPTQDPQNQAAHALLADPATDQYYRLQRAQGLFGNAMLRLSYAPKPDAGGAPAGSPPPSRAAAAPPGSAIMPAAQEPVRIGKSLFTLDARPDTLDFRDKLYTPTLVEVPSAIPLEVHLKFWRSKPPVLNQLSEGACTGFGLAAVAQYLLHKRTQYPDRTPVSPRMFYEMARRYDEWAGEAYSGSSARGAMKGWHKHGVCAASLWAYKNADPEGTLSPDRAEDALRRPLGAYFRVNHQDLVAMHSALAEVGILYATSDVHGGWSTVKKDGHIRHSEEILGGHAFAIVGYDDGGFWIQNSWGPTWGRGGFGHVTYDDWIEHASDVWVARLGAPVIRAGAKAGKALVSVGRSAEVRRAELQQHTIAIGNDGRLRNSGEVGNTPEDVERIFAPGGDFEQTTRTWTRKRLLLYAHGGLVNEASALQRVGEYRETLLSGEVYPLAFIWKTDFWSTLGNILKDVLGKRRPEGFLDSAKDFLLDRVDQTLEPLARGPGKLLWDEMKENAIHSTARTDGGAALVLRLITDLLQRDPSVEIHVAGHSAGSIFLGPLVRAFCANPQHRVASLTLWAPACTMAFFRECYVPALDAGQVEGFRLFTLKDPAEQDDHCARVYNKSLLYLVANAFEERPGFFTKPGLPRNGKPVGGTPLLGMERYIVEATDLFGANANDIVSGNPASFPLTRWPDAEWVRSPNNRAAGDPAAATARRHGDFDDDDAVVRTTFDLIRRAQANNAGALTAPHFEATAAGLRSYRKELGL